MKTNLFLITILFFASFFLNACSKDESPNPSPESYYLSVRICRLENDQIIPHADRLAYVIKSNGSSIYGVTDSDGWVRVVGTPAFSFGDEIHLKIYSLYEQNFIESPIISPKIASNFFVRSMSDFKSNLPPEGYHFLVIGLN